MDEKEKKTKGEAVDSEKQKWIKRKKKLEKDEEGRKGESEKGEMKRNWAEEKHKRKREQDKKEKKKEAGEEKRWKIKDKDTEGKRRTLRTNGDIWKQRQNREKRRRK